MGQGWIRRTSSSFNDGFVEVGVLQRIHRFFGNCRNILCGPKVLETVKNVTKESKETAMSRMSNATEKCKQEQTQVEYPRQTGMRYAGIEGRKLQWQPERRATHGAMDTCNVRLADHTRDFQAVNL